MLVIRLRRTGSKKRPFFRVVVADSRAARDSSFVEVLGHYNPRTKPETLKIDRERLEHWLQAGAVQSDTVRTLVDRMPETPETAAVGASTPAPATAGSPGADLSPRNSDLSADAAAKAEARSAKAEGAEADSSTV
jgi:small subunit ribosomal protein S16